MHTASGIIFILQNMFQGQVELGYKRDPCQPHFMICLQFLWGISASTFYWLLLLMLIWRKAWVPLSLHPVPHKTFVMVYVSPSITKSLQRALDFARIMPALTLRILRVEKTTLHSQQEEQKLQSLSRASMNQESVCS